MSKHKFSMKKKTGRRKNTKEHVALSKQIKKWKQARNTLFFKVCKRSFCFYKKETIVFFYHVVCFFSMQKDKNRKRVIKLIRVFKKKERETKGKQILNKENKKGWCSKTREILKRKLFFQKKERKASVQRHAIFCFLKIKTHKKVTRPEVQMLPNTCF